MPDALAAEVRDLDVRYGGPHGAQALRRVSLAVQPGECVAVVGESGCGKTTLGRALLGLLPEDAQVRGEARVGGRDILRMSPAARRTILGKDAAMVFQDPLTRLDPLLRIGDHFRELYRAHGLPLDKDASRQRAAEVLAEVGVPASRLGSYPHEVSGGQRQRVMIALGLALGPKLLVADEPTTALDVMVEAQVTELLRGLLQKRGMGLLLITHNLGLVAHIADRVAVLYAGELVEAASVQDAFAKPAHPYTRGLLASTIHAGTRRLQSIPGSPPDLASPPPACRFHPRCPRARALCAAREPPLARLGEQRALCWFPGPDAAVEPQAPKAAWGAPLPHATEVLG
ncbi:MAG: ABC transporter ATP-binding protein [Halobacteriales archaeon]|nr:ABC transporter ATP-binding protein [Halobacteriales archaeon]